MNTASERRPDSIIRYLDITAAHRALEAIGKETHQLAAMAKAAPFDDGDALARPLHNALAMHLDAAAGVVTGERPPVTPTAVDYDYAGAVSEALEGLQELALTIARRAFEVGWALDGGLITSGREWTADDINEGRMLASLTNDDNDHLGYAFDAMHLEGCVNALERERLFDFADITRDTYDRHMARIAAVAGAIDQVPAGTAERVGHAVAQWREDDDEAAHALDALTATLPARHAITGAKTYARLEAFATALTGPAWDAERRRAHKLMLTLSHKAYDMGTDGHGKTRDDAVKLFERLHAWRYDTYAECIATARVFADLEPGPDADGWAVAEEGAYYALYLAAGIATNTHQLLDVWNGAQNLSTDHRFNIRVGILLNFEGSRTGTGAPLADAGPGLGDATRALREKVDAYPVSKNSNLTHTVTYRNLKEAIEAIDASAPMADTGLIRAWAHVVKEADNAVITRRQTGELRRLVNAKVAEYGDGHEAKTAAMAARLPEWDRITDELNA